MSIVEVLLVSYLLVCIETPPRIPIQAMTGSNNLKSPSMANTTMLEDTARNINGQTWNASAD
jgi:hypothetical protein